jgi:hypothetical protein
MISSSSSARPPGRQGQGKAAPGDTFLHRSLTHHHHQQLSSQPVIMIRRCNTNDTNNDDETKTHTPEAYPVFSVHRQIRSDQSPLLRQSARSPTLHYIILYYLAHTPAAEDAADAGVFGAGSMVTWEGPPTRSRPFSHRIASHRSCCHCLLRLR